MANTEILNSTEQLRQPVFTKKTLLHATEDTDYGCGGAAIGLDGNIYVLPKITTKATNSRNYQNIGHGLYQLDPQGTQILSTVSEETVLHGPIDPVVATYEHQDDFPDKISTNEGGQIVVKNGHWAQYVDWRLHQPIQWQNQNDQIVAVPDKDGLAVSVDYHPAYEGYEDVRVSQMPGGEYVLTAVGIDAEQWWNAGWKDKTRRIQGCRVSMAVAENIADPSTYSEMMQIGPDYVFRNAFFTSEIFSDEEGRNCMRLIYRDLPNIHQSVIPIEDLSRMARDPKFREEFWAQELASEKKEKTLLLKPKFEWEAVREDKKWGHGQIASGCAVSIGENRQLLITGSPFDINDEGVTIGRVVGLTLLETDSNDQTKIRVVSRGPQPVLTPTEDDEINGKVEQVVFSVGATIVKGQDQKELLNIYYTGADSSFKVAQTSLEETLAWLEQFDENGEIVAVK